MAERPARKSGRKGIQSIETGFRIIDYLVGVGRPVPLKDIVAATGLSASMLQFYLISLVQIGVVHQERSTGHYGLGPYTLKLGLAGLEQFDIFAAARDRMVDLANDIRHTVFLGVWGTHGPTIIYRADGAHGRPIFELRVGAVLPVLRSALGRLFLAYLPESITTPLVESELADVSRVRPAQGAAADLPRNRIEVRKLIEATRAAGMSRSRSGLLSDYTAISAPVFDHTGTIIAGITAMGQIGVLDDDLAGASAQAIRRLADEISSDAGQRTTHYMKYMARE
jgi:DNA-binding IclR family transcriptional regulator